MTEPDPIDVHVGGVLRQTRAKRGLSLGGLSGRIGVSYQQLQKYETGVNRVSASMLHRIAAALDISVGDFFPKAGEHSILAKGSSDEDLRTSYALARIEDDLVRARLRHLIVELASLSD